MNEDELWAAIDTQRQRTADLLEALSTEEWDRASLCDGWTIRDVAAHLTLQQLGLGSVLLALIRHPGGVNHVIRESARSRARTPTHRLIAEIRSTVGSRRHNIGLTPLETLVDIVVHGQDIAIPLGRTLDVPATVAAAAADRVWWYGMSRRGRSKARVFRSTPAADYRFTATDAPWSVGDGPEIRGPVLAILLLLTGREAGLSDLAGEGVPTLAEGLARSDR